MHSIILRKTPGGEGHHAASASLAPLTICRDTRVWAIRQEADWMLVRSPGRNLGWVETSELATMTPELELLYNGGQSS